MTRCAVTRPAKVLAHPRDKVDLSSMSDIDLQQQCIEPEKCFMTGTGTWEK